MQKTNYSINFVFSFLYRRTIKEYFPYNFMYGKSSLNDIYGVKELLHQQNPNPKKDEILKCFSHINMIRRSIKNKNDFNIMFLYDDLQRLDENDTGYLPWNDIFHVIRIENEIPICKEKCEILIDYFQLRNNEDHVNYMEFVNLINELIPFPALGNLGCKCPTNLSTTYQDQTKNVLQNSHLTKNLSNSKIFQNEKNKNIENVSNIKNLISPTIPCLFGLSYKDFLLPRSKEQIRRIFKNAGYDLNDDKYFNNLFEKATKLPSSKNGEVSVEVFKYILDKENKKKFNIK